MKTVVTPIAQIKANPNNPRIIKDDKFHKLVKSIQEFPEMLNLRPIVAGVAINRNIPNVTQIATIASLIVFNSFI